MPTATHTHLFNSMFHLIIDSNLSESESWHCKYHTQVPPAVRVTSAKDFFAQVRSCSSASVCAVSEGVRVFVRLVS